MKTTRIPANELAAGHIIVNDEGEGFEVSSVVVIAGRRTIHYSNGSMNSGPAHFDTYFTVADVEAEPADVRSPASSMGSMAARQRTNMAAGLVSALVPADVVVHMAPNGVELLIGRPRGPGGWAHVVHGYDFVLAFEDAGHSGILTYLEGEAAGARAWVGAIDAMDALTIIRKHYQD